VTAYDIQHGKPSPDPYHKGLQLAGGLQPWEGIVVENAPMGIRSGVAAKIFTIGVNSGPLPDKALADERANIILPSIRELSNNWNHLFLK
jgi:beta-phosphoglucomutase-like phosphatase (HAD superfamily)